MSALIEAQAVSKLFPDKEGDSGGAVHAIRNAEFQIERGEFVALLGPSGCGKSTLLDIIAGLEPATSGRIIVEGETVLGPHRKMACVFQQMSLFPWRNALENVAFGLELRGIDAAERHRIAHERIELVGFAASRRSIRRSFPAACASGSPSRVRLRSIPTFF